MTAPVLRPYQRLCVDDAISFINSIAEADETGQVRAGVDRRRLYAAPTGCHARGERVLLWNGVEIAVEDVDVGYTLLGAGGSGRNVQRLHRGRQAMARVVPTKGEPFVVNLDHVLTLCWTQTEGRRQAGVLVDVTVREWLEWPRYAKHCAKLVRRPGEWLGKGPDDFPHMHPWLVGVFLGDGAISSGSATITNSAPEVERACQDFAARYGTALRMEGPANKRRLHFTDGKRVGRAGSPFIDRLRALGLFGLTAGEKFVPDAYIHEASVEARLELLAGMIDTDGHLTCGGYDWISKSGRMARQFTSIARSVGLAAYVKPCEKRSQLGSGGTYYRVSVSGDCDKIPCRVRRKRAPARRQKKDALRTGFTVELLPEDDYYGFEVDGDHRYLMADYTLTHNSGKGFIMATIHRTLREHQIDSMIVTPSLEIARGILANYFGVKNAPTGDESFFDLAMTFGVGTPTRLRNRMIDGRVAVPDVILVDEVHHAIEDSEVAGCNFSLGPASVWLGFTATPYRGTPAGTKALRDAWGDPFLLLTYPEAVAEGACVVPSVEIVPLVDDDLVKIVGGEFQDKAASAAVASKVDALAAIVARYAPEREPAEGSVTRATRSFDLPTMVSVPSTDCVGELVSALDRLGIDAYPITQATNAEGRARAFAACKARTACLVQIKVVSEGVDLPWLGRLIDARPMVSPVAWLQQLGRLTRPGHGPKHYVCVCRNVERHAYLLQGAIPRSAVAAAQAAFATPSKRAAGRIVGLEALGRLKPIPLPLAGGVTSSYFSVWRLEKGTRVKYAIIHDPATDEPLVARAVDQVVAGEEPVWGKWELAALPTDFEGFATSKRSGAATDKAKAAWKRMARKVGLDPEHDPKGRDLDALFMLHHLGVSLACEVTT